MNFILTILKKYDILYVKSKISWRLQMKKIEFDYLLKKFSIETDESDGSEFIKEYTEILLDKILSSANTQNINPSNALSIISNVGEQSQVSAQAPINQEQSDKLIDLFGITEKQLSYLIDFNNDSIKIIVRNKYIKGSKAEMQVKLSLLYCGACEYRNVKANTKEIRNICNTYQCLDSNFAPNIKKQNYFNITNAVNADIVLTMPGKDRLIEVVKEIFTSMESN